MAPKHSQDNLATLTGTLWHRFSDPHGVGGTVLLARLTSSDSNPLAPLPRTAVERLRSQVNATLQRDARVDAIGSDLLIIGFSEVYDPAELAGLRERIETAAQQWIASEGITATVSISQVYTRNEYDPDDRSSEALRRLLVGEITLHPVFQPIVSLGDGSVHGYEALVRGASGSPLEQPGALFATAERHDRLAQIDALCARTILREAAQKQTIRNDRTRLFLNIHPASLDAAALDGAFLSLPALARELQIDPERIVVEITERQSIPDMAAFARTLARFRNEGFTIAVDDAGAGYSSLEAIAALSPEYIKVDRSLISHIDREPNKRAMVAVIAGLAGTIGARVVAEGIETPGELGTLVDLGVDFAQGYLVARPAPDFVPPSRETAQRIAKEQERRRRTERSRGGPPLSDLAVAANPDDVLRPTETIGQVNERFAALPDDGGMAVIDPASGEPAGLLMKRSLHARLAVPYGHELLDRKQVSAVMETHPLVLDENVSLDGAVRRLLGRGAGKLDDLILVTHEGKYAGSIPGRHLLTRATELQLRQARYSNPLTGLPGNVPIEQEVTARLISGDASGLFYIDLDHFKPYNDRYGVARGDDAIQALARALTEAVDCEREDLDLYNEDFVGHLGGDDFFVIAAADRGERLVSEIIRRFEMSIDALHAPEDRKRGYFIGHDRRGVLTEFPLLTISIAVLVVAGREAIPDFAHAAETLSELKAEAKQLPGSSFLIRDTRLASA